jgi:hypothetical protein
MAGQYGRSRARWRLAGGPGLATFEKTSELERPTEEIRLRVTSSKLWLLWLGLLCAACSRSGLGLPDEQHRCLAIAGGRYELSAKVKLDRTDILFLIDTSSSMAAEIEQIRHQLVDVIVPEIRLQVSDPQLGVAVFSDFGEAQVGERSHPYELMQPVTEDIDAVLEATRAIELEFGGDTPESHLEALYQVATGDGLGVYVEPNLDCPDDTHAGVCFREGSFPVVMLFTDAPMRNVRGISRDGIVASEPGDDPNAPDTPFVPYLRKYEETMGALQAQNIRVLGLWSRADEEGLDDLRRIVMDSGALDAQGQPVVIDIGETGSQLGQGVVSSLASVSSGTRHELQLVLEDADETDALDPRTLVTGVRALRAEPLGFARAEGDRFVDVRTGTQVFFEVSFDGTRAPATLQGERFPLRLSVQSSDGVVVSEEIVDVIAQAQCAEP